MKLILDVHCHTVNSGHAYSTVSENAAHAASIGLTHIGMADHGPAMPGGAHLYNFLNLDAVPEFIHGVRVLKGVEANIISYDGELDLPKAALARLDFVIASLHRGVLPTASRSSNTKALIGAAENPNVHIIGHPNNIVYPIDINAVVEAAARTHTIIEINNHSLIPGSFRFDGDEEIVQTINLCKEYGVKMLVSSDAHFCTSVGSFALAKQLIEAAEVPEELIVNTSAERFAAAVKEKGYNPCHI